MTAIPRRPPFPQSEGVELALIYFAIVVGMFVALLPVIVAFAIVDRDWTGLRSFIGFYAAIALVGFVALALARRKPWSRRAAIAAIALTTAGAAFLVIDAVRNADEHGSPYGLMGGAMWFPFGVGVLYVFIRTAGPEAFRPLPAGWMDDPAHEARLRYWDGECWTAHVAP